LLAVPLSIFLVSLAGIPPTFGFIAKLNLFAAVIDANLITAVIIALLNTVVSVYYYSRLLKHMYFSKSEDTVAPIKVQKMDLTVVFLLAGFVIFFGVFFNDIIEFVKNSAQLL